MHVRTSLNTASAKRACLFFCIYFLCSSRISITILKMMAKKTGMCDERKYSHAKFNDASPQSQNALGWRPCLRGFVRYCRLNIILTMFSTAIVYVAGRRNVDIPQNVIIIIQRKFHESWRWFSRVFLPTKFAQINYDCSPFLRAEIKLLSQESWFPSDKALHLLKNLISIELLYVRSSLLFANSSHGILAVKKQINISKLHNTYYRPDQCSRLM